MQDKFDIVDGTEGNSLVDAITNKKASLLYKDWKCNMRRHYRKLRKAKVDPYSSPYPGMHMDDWKYLIDKVFKDPKIRVSYSLLVLNSYVTFIHNRINIFAEALRSWKKKQEKTPV